MEYVFIGWVFSFIEAPELLGSIMTTRANQRICLRFHSHVLFGRQLVPCVQVEWELAFSISMCAALIPMTEFIYFNAAPNSLSNICRHILLLFLGWTRPAHSVFRSLADDDCNCARSREFFFCLQWNGIVLLQAATSAEAIKMNKWTAVRSAEGM